MLPSTSTWSKASVHADIPKHREGEMMPSSGVVTLLHLSDLHFGRHHRFTSGDGPDSLLERLRVDLDELREKEAVRPDLVVVSGDLAEFGDTEEFEQATRFLRQLAQTIGLALQRFIIVPGNHDINWDLSRSYFAECKAYKKVPQRPYFKKFAFFGEAFTHFYAGHEGVTFTEEEPWSFFEYPELGVVVAGLNSVIAESHEDHFGFLGEKQLRAFAEKLRPYKERGFLRIGVMHHNPRDRRGGAETEHDQEQLNRLLGPFLNVLLHGDQHKETDVALRVKVPIFGVGSLGAALEQRPEEVPNEYQLLQIHADGIRRFLRAYAPDQKRFLPSARADAEGTASVVDIAVPFERVETLGQTKLVPRATDLEALVAQYRAAIVKDQQMQTVGDLLGRDALGMPMTAMDFLQLFVPQDVMREAPIRHSDRRDLRALREEFGPEFSIERLDKQTNDFDEIDSFPMPGYGDSLAGALARGWTYLLGAPGAGKTALTRWILLSLCVPGESIDGFSDNLVPVRIDMRKFHAAHEKATTAFSFFEYLESEHKERFLNLQGDSLRELARQGRLYFLFDGLDEVIDEAKRRTYAEMITGLAHAQEYAQCRGVVTSRVVGAEVAQSLFDGTGFSTYTLRDFTEKQQDQFLDAWHRLVFAHEPEMRAHRRTRLARALAASTSLRALCGNPLCCSLLAYLNRDEELPEGRHHLYQKILERLAEHWDANKGLPVRNAALKFELSDKLSFLRRLAWSMMEAGGAEAGNAIAREKLVAFAQSFCEEQWAEPPDAARRRAEGLIASLRERNEVLAWLGGDLYGFSHRALLEYSAAARAIEKHGRREGISQLAQWFRAHWRDETWEETLLLTCGLLREVEQGPALVVQVLQEMGEDRAAVYRELDEYLCFWIKALGELRTLERGLPREFAEKINGVLEYWIGRKPLTKYRRLRNPLRRCAGKWPQLSELINATARAIDEGHFRYGGLYLIWIAAAGRSGRLDLVLRFIRSGRPKGVSGVDSICKEAARCGPWSPNEVAILCDAADADSKNRFHVLASIINTPGMSFRVEERVVKSITEMMTTASSESFKLSCASLLLRNHLNTTIALNTIRKCMISENGLIRARAARNLVAFGHVDEAIATIFEGAAHDPTCLGVLMDLARTNANANHALRDVVSRIGPQTDLKWYTLAFIFGFRRGYTIVSHSAMSQRLRALNPKDAARLLKIMATTPGLASFVAGEYHYLLQVLPESPTRNSIITRAMSLDVHQGGENVKRLWAMMVASNNVSVFVVAATGVLKNSGAPINLRLAARQRSIEYLQLATSDSARLRLAGALGTHDPIAKPVFEQVARSGQGQNTRLNAAKEIGNLIAIDDLAKQSLDPWLKTKAREAQDLYAHIHDLLHVGRPRRAIVKLHNEFVGILEETKFQADTKFTYDRDYLAKPGARPLAPNLPLRAEPYEHPDKLHPFFANLLPEGTILEQKARRHSLQKTDRFGILLKVGEDVMGAVQVFPEEAN